jgi:hypothetical protein
MNHYDEKNIEMLIFTQICVCVKGRGRERERERAKGDAM